MTTHSPTCETLRGGDHGPCDCGYDAAQAERRRKIYTAEELIDLVGAVRDAVRSEPTLGFDEVVDAMLAVRDAVEATVRQRDALREAARRTADLCGHCCFDDGPCVCSRLRAALEVR